MNVHMPDQLLRCRRVLSLTFFSGIFLLAGSVSATTIDTTDLLTTDFDTYDMGMSVRSIVENTDAYFVEYAYETVEAVDARWQRVPKTASMRVSKEELGERDLGLYVASQLDQIADQERTYLKAVQKEERKEAEAGSSIPTEYASIIGQRLNGEEQTFEGYQPVKPPVVEMASAKGDERTIAASAVSESASEPDTVPDTSALDMLASKIATLEEKIQILTQLVDTLTEFYTTFNLSALIGQDGA